MSEERPLDPGGLYPIRVVARRTGLTSHVIRAWEKRYGAVVPHRSETNRRLYSEGDIARLALLKQATEYGHSISRVSACQNHEIQALLEDDAATVPTSTATDLPETYVKRALNATSALDALALRTCLEEASRDLTRLRLYEQVICPLMHRIGDLWQKGELQIVHEHTAFSAVRDFLVHLRGNYAPSAGAPTVVVTTPSGQIHELGALIVADAAASNGWNVVYTGPGLPAEDIARAVDIHRARAVALSVIYPPDDAALPEELARLRRLVGRNVMLLVGGQAASAYKPTLETIDAIGVRNLSELRENLQVVRGV